MNELARLTQNEMMKVARKRRFFVVVLILFVLIPLFVYAQGKQAKTVQERLGTSDWRVAVQQQIVDAQNRLSSARIPDEWRRWLKISMAQQQYYLAHDINPTAPGAPTFAKEFIQKSSGLFLPLLVMIIATDLVAGEHGDGTIKLLLTRPVKRWKILLSKLIALILYVSLIIFMTVFVAYAISGLAFGYSGWSAPILTGFSVNGSELDTSNVRLIPLWQYLGMVAGLTWFVGVVIGIISLMVSVLIRSVAAGMGVMVAAIIAGTVLSAMASSWEGAKYLFIVNLDLPVYLSGEMPPIPGMTLPLSLTVLSLSALGALVVAFVAFMRQDVMG